MSYILHFTKIEDDDARVHIGEVRRIEYITLIDGDLTEDNLKTAKEDAVLGFECSNVIDIGDVDLSLLALDIPLVTLT